MRMILKETGDGEIAIGDYKEAWATDARRNASEYILEKIILR